MKKKLFNTEQEIEIINLYVDKNFSMSKISAIYNCSINPIHQILKDYNIPRRKQTRSLFDESYFEEINSPEKAYFLGLLMADGCNYRKGFTLSLQDQDFKIIEKFKTSIGFTGNINYRKHTNPKYKGIVRIKIHSNLVSKQLDKWNVIPNKSLNTVYPNIKEEYDSHFIRGVFDGDGCISNYRVQNKYNSCEFSIIGYSLFIKQIQNKLVSYCNLPISKLKMKNNNSDVLSVRYGGRKQVLKIFEWLYKDCDDLYIDRKYLKFKEIEKWNIK